MPQSTRPQAKLEKYARVFEPFFCFSENGQAVACRRSNAALNFKVKTLVFNLKTPLQTTDKFLQGDILSAAGIGLIELDLAHR